MNGRATLAFLLLLGLGLWDAIHGNTPSAVVQCSAALVVWGLAARREKRDEDPR